MSTYTPIATQTLGSAAASVIFSSIPQGYTDLILLTSTKTSSSAADGAITCTVNGDTGSNYSHTALYGTGSTAETFRSANLTKLYFGRWGNAQYTITKTQFNNYSNNTRYKTVLSQGGNTTDYIFNWVNLWRNTSAITSMELRVDDATNFAAGSTFTIYGIAVGNSSAKADGGSSVTTDGTYWYHTYRSSGAFTPRQALTNVDYLVVAGGGGGGTGYGGGGGGGGFRTSVGASTLSLSSNTTYPVVVGAGGAGGPAINTGALSVTGTNGGYSNFASITSTGGGGGAKTVAVGNAGGSGGGGGGDIGTVTGGSGNAGGYSPVEGYNGGAGSNANNGAGGGGGGASAAGSAGSGSTGGAGGAGAASSLSGSSVTYAGGGGGGTYSSTAGAGGAGGGGAGSGTVSVSGGNGTAFLGGGGGGGGASVNYSASGNGGSGIVIVRYAV